MSTAYRISRSALGDLQEVSDFWTLEAGEDAALRVVGGVMDAIVTMSGQPKAGVGADQFGAGVRKFPAGRYVVYYRPYLKGIEILHVFHGARDQPGAWKRGGRGVR